MFKAKRKTRAVGYFLLLLSSCCSLFIEPSAAITAQVDDPWKTIWALIFLASSAMCFIAAVTDYWIFEYAGLPALFGTFAVYGVSILLQGQTVGLTVLPIGLSCMSISFLFHARWVDIKYIYRYEKDAVGAK